METRSVLKWQQNPKLRSPTKIKEGNDRHLTSHSAANLSAQPCFPWNRDASQTTHARNYFSPQMMMLQSIDLNWDTPLCSALGRKHWQCIYNWTEAHYTVTSHRDLLFGSRDKVSMPAGQYNCPFHLPPHERLLSLSWLWLNWRSSWNRREFYTYEWIFCTRIQPQTRYVQFTPEVMLI